MYSANSFLVLSLSLSVLPLNDHGDLLCFSLDAYLIWCLSRSDPGITCIRIPWGRFLGGSWSVTTLGVTQTSVTRIPSDEASDCVLKYTYK